MAQSPFFSPPLRWKPQTMLVAALIAVAALALLLVLSQQARAGNNEPQWSTDTGGDVNAVDLSSNGRYLASGSQRGQLYLYDMQNPDNAIIDYTAGGDILDVALSADGRYLVAGTSDSNVYLFDRDNLFPSTPVSSFETEGPVNQVDITPDGSLYVAGTSQSSPYYLHMFNNGEQNPYRSERLWYGAYDLALAANGDNVSIIDRYYLKYYTTTSDDSGYEWYRYLGAEGKSVDISQDGLLMVAGLTNGQVKMYNSTNGIQWETSSGTASINAVDMTPSADYVVAGDGDGAVRLYNSTGYILFENVTENTIKNVALSSDGKRFSAVVQYMQPDQKKVLHFYPEASEGVYWYYKDDKYFMAVALSSNGEWTAAGSTNDIVYYFDGEGDANQQPVAVIDSIDPSPALVGDEVTFDGSSSNDPDGNIVAYEWESDLDGLLSTSATFSRDNLSQGDHTITLKVRDEGGVWSEPATWDLAVHTAPTATIDEIDPNPVHAGKQVSFSGTGSDDGTIEEYLWESDQLVDPLGTTASFTYTFDESGTHTITFKVRDNNGQWSEAATQRLDVLEPVNERPTAVIDSIAPASPLVGEQIVLKGRGLDSDGEIENYEWSSNLNGDLGNSATVVTTLSEGTHTISLRVQDDSYEWSDPVTETLVVQGRLIAIISASRLTGEVGDLFSFRGGDSQGPVYEYFFDFDDGTTSNWTTEKSVTHIYESSGTYTVTLKVRDDQGHTSDERAKTVSVSEKDTRPENPNTGDDTPGNSEGTPGPGLALAGLALLAPALLRRRRGS